MPTAKQILETATNLAILVVCGLICWTLFTHRTLSLGGTAGGAILEGKTLQDLPSYHWDGHPRTLVLGMRTGCHFCAESLPFYKHLGEMERSNALQAHLLAVMPEKK
jgi:hypothetical protein